MTRTTPKILALALFAAASLASGDARISAAGPAKGSYATVNGVNMYNEIAGKGRPIVLIHGAFCTIDGCFGKLVELLSKNRQVIAVELQGHGHGRCRRATARDDVDGRRRR